MLDWESGYCGSYLSTLCNRPLLFSNFAWDWPWLPSLVTWKIDVQACVHGCGRLVITSSFLRRAGLCLQEHTGLDSSDLQDVDWMTKTSRFLVFSLFYCFLVRPQVNPYHPHSWLGSLKHLELEDKST